MPNAQVQTMDIAKFQPFSLADRAGAVGVALIRQKFNRVFAKLSGRIFITQFEFAVNYMALNRSLLENDLRPFKVTFEEFIMDHFDNDWMIVTDSAKPGIVKRDADKLFDYNITADAVMSNTCASLRVDVWFMYALQMICYNLLLGVEFSAEIIIPYLTAILGYAYILMRLFSTKANFQQRAFARKQRWRSLFLLSLVIVIAVGLYVYGAGVRVLIFITGGLAALFLWGSNMVVTVYFET